MPPQLPTASVVVPTFQRPARLVRCLTALAAQDYPAGRFEVVVVNDGGALPDGPLAPLRERLALTVVHQANAGPAAARNRGVAHAAGEIVAFTDDDCEPAADWLRRLGAALAAEPACMAGGHTVNALRDLPCAEASQLLVDYLYEHFDGTSPARARFFTSNNLALARARFLELGGFDATFPRAAGEDRDLCDRWARHGWPMCLVPEAVVRHAHDMGLSGFWRQHYAYGAAAYHFHHLRARRAAERLRVEPASFYGRLLLHPFASGRGARAPRVGSLLLLSEVANALGYAVARWRGE
jgi:GT2 family glycosyltransferase